MEILREKYTSRGGGIEISLDEYGYEGEKMTAYQNYCSQSTYNSFQ